MSSENTYSSKVVKGSLLIFISVVVATVLGYVLRLFLSRNLTLEQFGLLYAVLIFFGFFGLFRDLGLNHTIVKFIPEFFFRKQFDKIKSFIIFVIIFQIIVSLIIVIPILYFSDYIALAYFHSIDATIAIQLLSITFLLNAFLSIFQSALQGFNKITYYSVIQPLSMTITLGSIYFLVSLTLLGAVLGYVIAAVVMAVVTFFMFLKSFPKFSNLKTSIDKPLIKKGLSFSLPVFIGFIGGFLLSYTDTMVLTYFKTLTDVAYYQVALPTSQILWIISTPVVTVLFPVISEMSAKAENKLISKTVSISLKFTLVLIIPIATTMFLFSDYIIIFLFGSTYLPASLTLQILSLAAIPLVLWSVCTIILTSIGQPKIGTKIVIGSAIFNLIGAILLVQFLGIVGVAITTALSFLIAFIASYLFLKKAIIIKSFEKNATKSLLGGGFMLLIMILIKNLLSIDPIINTIASFLIGVVFYSVFVLYTKVITKNELRTIKKVGVPIPKFVLDKL
ncbi:MAG: flippase [Candidatus Aenigmarchaeota archaeon]|nr:flippase [Candidatus Aenigmarchaeota archaeon]